MDLNNSEISRLKSLPQDLLGEIVSRVGATSPKAFHNLMLSCKELGASSNDERVCKNLNLAPLVKNPLAAFKYYKLMDKCLANNNQDAHYIKGIQQYFVQNRPLRGLHHLQIAANEGHKEAIYLYGIIQLCRDMIEEGKNYLRKLKWEEEKTTVNNCWENIKGSLHGIRVGRKRLYFTALRKMKPTNLCHLNDMQNTCSKCFYYKQMVKFVYVI